MVLKKITVTFAVLMLTVLCSSAFVSVPTITDGIGFQYENITIGDDRIQIGNTNITKEATFVVAASDSLHKEGADFICDELDDQVTIQAAIDATYAAGGGKVVLVEGNYIVASTITGKDYVDMEGVGFGTVLDVSTIGGNRIIEMGDYSSLSHLKIAGDISTFIAESQSVLAGNHSFIDNIWIHETSYGITTSEKENVHVSNYIATNIRGVNDWAAAFQVGLSSTTVTKNIYLSDFHFEGCNRGCEVEANCQNVFIERGYMKDIKNYNGTGNAAFSCDVHSHGTYAPRTVVYRDIILDNCTMGWNIESIGDIVVPEDITFDNIKLYNYGTWWNRAHGNNLSINNVDAYRVYVRGDKITFKNMDFKCLFNLASTIVSSEDVIFSDCLFANTNALAPTPDYGIKIDDASVKRVTFHDCKFTSINSFPVGFLGLVNADSDIHVVDCEFYNDIIYNNISTKTTIKNNIGYTTENSGTATLTSGTTVKTITHGLAVTPVAGDIMVTPMESLGSASFFWINGYTSATFNVTVSTDPTQDVDFAWSAIVL